MNGLRPGQVRAAALHHGVHPPARRLSPTALAALGCPHCGAHLRAGDGAVSCADGHAFDIAKQGYVALLGSGSRTDTGDSSDMVSARVEFLGAGHFAPIACAVVNQVARRLGDGAGPVLEIGAGTGYYLQAVLDGASVRPEGGRPEGGRPGGLLPDGVPADPPVRDDCAGRSGIALDSSKYAARRAAADDRVISVLADAWSPLPVRPGAVGAVLTVFAPRDPAEICRVLAPDGLVVAVTPAPSHLTELRQWLTMLVVDEGKADRLAAGFDGRLELIGQQAVEFEMTLDRAAVAALVRMGPSARHVTPAGLTLQIDRMPARTRVTGSVVVSTFGRPSD